MTEESTFLVTEIWLDSNRMEEFKPYRVRLLDLIGIFNPEYIYYGHPFAWVLNTDDGRVPTGIEVWRFESETVARQALDGIEKSGLLSEGNQIANKTRCYLARYATPV